MDSKSLLYTSFIKMYTNSNRLFLVYNNLIHQYIYEIQIYIFLIFFLRRLVLDSFGQSLPIVLLAPSGSGY